MRAPGGGGIVAPQATRFVALVETPGALESAVAAGIAALVRPAGEDKAVLFEGRRVFWAVLGDLPDARLLERAAASGAQALILDTGRTRLLDRFTFGDLSAVADACRERQIGIGFAGGLEAPDVPRLMPLRPVLLGFEDLAALPREPVGDDAPTRAAHPQRPDRVFIRDLVQEMEIGAYASERGRRQRVCFSVEAELAANAQRRSIGDIYSYDRMMDAVRALAASAPQAFVETLAEALAEDILADDRILAVTIRVEKLDLGPAAAGVEIYRQRR